MREKWRGGREGGKKGGVSFVKHIKLFVKHTQLFFIIILHNYFSSFIKIRK